MARGAAAAYNGRNRTIRDGPLMPITLNGETHPSDGLETVAHLLEALGVHGQRVAVMVNGRVVKKDAFEAAPITEGDRVEVIQMVGGG